MKVLITGATGFVGKALVKLLLDKNHEIIFLTTSKDKINSIPNCKGFYWNPNNLEIDNKSIENVDFIVNLSGKSISCRWTEKNKKEILESRINSSKTLYKLLSENKNTVKKVISASAIGIYKSDFNNFQDEETSIFNTDFLGEVCQKWENENVKFNELGIQTLIVRFGLVLSENQGALPQFAKTINWYVGGLLGSGKQWYSWIHYQDLVRILYFGFNENMSGVFNAVAPNPKTQKRFLIILSKVLKRKLTMPRVPTGFLNLFLGEMHHLVTDSQKISSDKLLKNEFEFMFPTLKKALKDLYKKSPL